MITKYVAFVRMCHGSACDWVQGKGQHDELWQCLYEVAEMRPKYYEPEIMSLVDCRITSYKHNQ